MRLEKLASDLFVEKGYHFHDGRVGTLRVHPPPAETGRETFELREGYGNG